MNFIFKLFGWFFSNIILIVVVLAVTPLFTGTILLVMKPLSAS